MTFVIAVACLIAGLGAGIFALRPKSIKSLNVAIDMNDTSERADFSLSRSLLLIGPEMQDPSCREQRRELRRILGPLLEAEYKIIELYGDLPPAENGEPYDWLDNQLLRKTLNAEENFHLIHVNMQGKTSFHSSHPVSAEALLHIFDLWDYITEEAGEELTNVEDEVLPAETLPAITSEDSGTHWQEDTRQLAVLDSNAGRSAAPPPGSTDTDDTPGHAGLTAGPVLLAHGKQDAAATTACSKDNQASQPAGLTLSADAVPGDLEAAAERELIGRLQAFQNPVITAAPRSVPIPVAATPAARALPLRLNGCAVNSEPEAPDAPERGTATNGAAVNLAASRAASATQMFPPLPASPVKVAFDPASTTPPRATPSAAPVSLVPPVQEPASERRAPSSVSQAVRRRLASAAE